MHKRFPIEELYTYCFMNLQYVEGVQNNIRLVYVI